MGKCLKQDWQRAIEVNKASGLGCYTLLLKQEVWSIICYRFGSWVHFHCHIFGVRHILKVIAIFVNLIVETLTGITLPFSTSIGPGLYIAHFGGIIVHYKARIGKGCTLSSGVVIGNSRLGSDEAPTIGDNVFIGVGAKVLGNIKVGNNVRIGANAVVLQDIPDNATAVGIPAKIK